MRGWWWRRGLGGEMDSTPTHSVFSCCLGGNFVYPVATNDVALNEVRTEKPLQPNGADAVDPDDSQPAQEEDERPRVEKSVLQGKLTKLAIQIGYGGKISRVQKCVLQGKLSKLAISLSHCIWRLDYKDKKKLGRGIK